MVQKKVRVKQVRVDHMSLDELRNLLDRRLLGVQYVRFLISQKENN